MSAVRTWRNCCESCIESLLQEDSRSDSFDFLHQWSLHVSRFSMWSSTLSNCAQIGGKRKGKTHLLVRHHQVTKRRKRRKRRRRSRRRRLVWCSSGFLMPLACYFRTHPSGKKGKKEGEKTSKERSKRSKKGQIWQEMLHWINIFLGKNKWTSTAHCLEASTAGWFASRA